MIYIDRMKEFDEGFHERTAYFDKRLNFLNCDWPEDGTRDGNGLTSLHYLALCGLKKSVEGLPSDLGPKIAKALESSREITTRNVWGQTPLHFVAATGAADGAQLLQDFLHMDGVAVNARDEWDLTPLHYTVMYSDDNSRVSILLDHGADPTAKNVVGRTAFDILENAGAWKDSAGHWALKDAQWWTEDDFSIKVTP